MSNSVNTLSVTKGRIRDCYEGNLTDLGDIHSESFRSIFRDPNTFDLSMPGVTQLFTTKAADYSAQFDNADCYRTYLANAFARLPGMDFDAPYRILDIGVGSGSSTFVLLQMFPNAQVVACDISAEMLQLTRRRLAQHPGMLERCLTIQLDSEKLSFKKGSFDLVVGAANLHHLFHPERTIQQCSTILKSGGHALFFDPFEPGNALLAMASHELSEKLKRWKKKNPLYWLPVRLWHRTVSWAFRRLGNLFGKAKNSKLLLKFSRFLSRHGKIDTLIAFLENHADVIQLMARPDKEEPAFKNLDDKWLFTRAFFTRTAEDAGFSNTWIYPLNNVDAPFESQARYLLKTCGQLDEVAPDWSWEIYRRLDRVFSLDLKRDLMIEGCIIMQK